MLKINYYWTSKTIYNKVAAIYSHKYKIVSHKIKYVMNKQAHAISSNYISINISNV